MSESESSSSKKRKATDDDSTSPSDLDALRKELDDREKDLDAREEDLASRERSAKAAAAVAACPGEPSDGDIIQLNVGGRTGIAVSRRTLTAIPGSMLESRFSGRWDDSIEKDDDGRFFIDDDPDLFLKMLNFLRALAKCSDPNYLLESPEPRNDLDRLLSHYGTLHAIYPMSLERILDDASGIKELREEYSNFSISTTSHITFKLIPSHGAHNRRICKYRVKLGKFQSAQIGWIDEEIRKEVGVDEYLGEGNAHFIFDCDSGDVVDGGMVENDDESPESKIKASEGSEIESCFSKEKQKDNSTESTVTFKVDGKQIFEAKNPLNRWIKQIPTFAIEGEIDIIEFVYETPPSSPCRY